MRLEHEQGLLKAAAAETLRQVRKDRARVPLKIRPLLSYIEDRLFDPQLNVNHLKLACHIRDNSAMVRFHSAVGSPPGAYITELRLRTASRLLRESCLPVWQVAELVGYSTIQVFSQAFKRWSGQRPTSFREQTLASALDAADGAWQEEDIAQPKAMRNALNGILPREHAQRLIARLQSLYAEKISPPVIKEPIPPRRRSLLETERGESQDIWAKLGQMSWKERRAEVRRVTRFSTPALFHLLRQKSRELGRGDRPLGIHLAELAVESLSAIDRHLSQSQRDNLRAQGWAWIANARRLALDLPGSEEAFLTAERFLTAGEQPNRKVEAELYTLKAGLRWYQQRFDEALQFASNSIQLAKRLSEPSLSIEPLTLRAIIHENRGEWREGIADLQEAIGCIDVARHPFLLLSATYSLTFIYAKSGRLREAGETLPRAVALFNKLDVKSFEPHLLWMDGFLSYCHDRLEEAEKKFRLALNGFAEQRQALHVAVVSLDVALCCLRREQIDECEQLVARVLPIFGALKVGREVLAARKLLAEAHRNRTLNQVILEQARECLERWRQDPTAPPVPLETLTSGQPAKSP